MGLSIKGSKLQVGQSIKFAGFIVSDKGVSADPEKISAITDFPEPENVRDVRSFLGLANQLGSFVPDLAIVTAPLRALLKKSTAWTWEEPQHSAFSATKRLLTSTSVVCYYDPGLQTILLTDASKLNGLGFAPVSYTHLTLPTNREV